jgi:Carboxypeptidase regulatory-like domain
MHERVCSVKNIVFADCLSRMRFLLFLVVALIGFSVSTFAQQATIVGTVTDPSGAVVPNVNVTITNTDTGVSRTIPTNDAGQYVAPDLQVGHYAVKAEAKGFKVAERKDVVVSVGDRIRVDFQMQMGAAQETVTVEAAAVHVQTDTGEQSSLISGDEVQQLAMNGRSIYSLTVLTPGASSNMPDFQVATPVGGNSAVSFNGLRYAHNIYLLDGGEDLDRGGSGTISVMPSTDAIGEFRELTSNYSAEYGLSSAMTATMVIKSGTNQIHASAWEFDRNNAFDARNFFNPAPQTVAELRLNVFGFNVGGPVTFGKLYNPDKKKTFFFYNMEWRRLIQGGVLDQTVPASSEYGGVFPSTLSAQNLHTPCTNQVSSAIATQFANAGQALSTPDPTTGACSDSNGNAAILRPFTNNTIPTALLSNNAQLLLAAGIFPAPNALNTGGQPTFEGGNNSPTNVKEEIVRLDHNFTSRFSVFGHFIAEQIAQGFGTSQWSNDNLPTVSDTFGNPSYSAVVHTTYIISPTLVNEVAFNYNGNRINIVPAPGNSLSSLSEPTGYENARLFPGPNTDDRLPSILLQGSTGANFDISSWPWHNVANDYQIRDDISWTKGSHQFKMGGSWALYKKVQELFGETQGTFGFNGAYTGSDFADFLLGYANSYSELAVQDSGHWNNVSWAGWFQDNWRVSRRLTLNLGLRWDGVPHTYEANDRMGNFYPQLYNPANAATFDSVGNICYGAADAGCSAASPGLGTSPNPILAGVPIYLNGIGIPGQCYTQTSGGNFCVPKGLVNNHWGAFGPRLGFAYDIFGTGKTVLRGGFGVMYERIQGNDMYDAGPNIPFSLNAGLSGVSLDNANVSLLNGSPAAGSPLVPIVPAAINGLEYNNYNLPVSYQYSFGVQHSLTNRTVFSLSYVGNENRHQSDQVNINLVPTSDLPGLINKTLNYNTAPGLDFLGFNGILQAANEANSHYNALQASLNGQLVKDLQVQFAYTWSRSIDPSTGGDNGDLATVTNPYCGWSCDIGPSQFNRTNIFLAEFVYDIPLLRHTDNHLLRTLAGGWELSGIVTAESGLPLDIGLSGPQGSNGLPDATNRPDQVGALSYPHTPAEWFNTSAFATPALGAWGNVGFDSVTGPGRDNWNLSLFKSFLLSESRGSRLELRLETFNTWNHTQFNAVSTSLGSSNFGQLTGAADPRVLQLGGKIYF